MSSRISSSSTTNTNKSPLIESESIYIHQPSALLSHCTYSMCSDTRHVVKTRGNCQQQLCGFCGGVWACLALPASIINIRTGSRVIFHPQQAPPPTAPSKKSFLTSWKLAHPLPLISHTCTSLHPKCGWKFSYEHTNWGNKCVHILTLLSG